MAKHAPAESLEPTSAAAMAAPNAVAGAVPLVKCEHVDHVAILTLANPARRNALGRALLDELLRAFAPIGADRAIKCVILKAAGPVFSSGHDLREIAAAKRADAESLFAICTERDGGHSALAAASDRASTGNRHGRRLPVSRYVRSGRGGRRGHIRHSGREDRSVLFDARGGTCSGRLDQESRRDAAHRNAH